MKSVILNYSKTHIKEQAAYHLCILIAGFDVIGLSPIILTITSVIACYQSLKLNIEFIMRIKSVYSVAMSPEPRRFARTLKSMIREFHDQIESIEGEV